jgi:DNA-binding NarL/FixJ family response regulator
MTKTVSLVLMGTEIGFLDELRHSLAVRPNFSVVGAATDLAQGLSLIKQWTPTVSILNLSNLDASTVLNCLMDISPRTRTIIVARRFNEAHLRQVFQAGCAGYVMADQCASEIVRAVRAVTIGQHYLGYPLLERAIDAYLDYGRTAFQNFPNLTPDFTR